MFLSVRAGFVKEDSYLYRNYLSNFKSNSVLCFDNCRSYLSNLMNMPCCCSKTDSTGMGGLTLGIARSLVTLEQGVVRSISHAISVFARICNVDLSSLNLCPYIAALLERATTFTRVRVLTEMFGDKPATPAQEKLLKFFLVLELLWFGSQVVETVVPMLSGRAGYCFNAQSVDDSTWVGTLQTILVGISPAAAYLLCRAPDFAKKVRDVCGLSGMMDRVIKSITTVVDLLLRKLHWTTSVLPDRVQRWCQLVDELEQVYKEPDGVVTHREKMAKDQSFRSSLIRMLTEGKTLKMEFESLNHKDIVKVIQDRLVKLQQLVRENIGTYVGAQGKTKPVTVFLWGRPGVGKTVCIDYLMADLYYLLGEEFNPVTDRYTIDQTTPYFDTYAYQKVVDVQDFFQSRDKIMRLQLVNNLMNMTDESVCPLNIAECSGKGTMFFSSDFVILTSNLGPDELGTHLASVIESPEAFHRRIDVYAEVIRDGPCADSFDRSIVTFTVARGQKDQTMDWNEFLEYLVMKKVKSPSKAGFARGVKPFENEALRQSLADRINVWKNRGTSNVWNSQADSNDSSTSSDCPTTSSVGIIDLVSHGQTISVQIPPEVGIDRWKRSRSCDTSMRYRPPTPKSDDIKKLTSFPTIKSQEDIVDHGKWCQFREKVGAWKDAVIKFFYDPDLNKVVDTEDLITQAAMSNHVVVDVPKLSWREWFCAKTSYLREALRFDIMSTISSTIKKRLLDFFSAAVTYLPEFVLLVGGVVAAVTIYRRLRKDNMVPDFMAEGPPRSKSDGSENDTFQQTTHAKLRPARRGYRETRRAGYASEAWKAANMDIMNQKVTANLCWISAGKSSSTCSGISGLWVAVPLHIFHDLSNDNITITNLRNDVLSFNMSELRDQDVVMYESRHLVLLNLHSVNRTFAAFETLHRYLFTESELPVCASSGALFTLRKNTGRGGSYLVTQLVATDFSMEPTDLTIIQDKEQYMMEGGYVYDTPSQKGDCGGIVVVDMTQRGMILGIHVGGALGSQGLCCFLTQEMIDFIKSYPQVSEIIATDEKTQPDLKLAPSPLSLTGSFSNIVPTKKTTVRASKPFVATGIVWKGQAIGEQLPYHASTTKLRPSEFRRVLGEETKTAPSVLKVVSRHGVPVRPSDVFLDKFKFTRSFPVDLEESAVMWLHNQIRVHPRVLNFDEAFEGPCGLPAKGGVGYPWYKKYRTRQQLLDDHSVLRIAVSELLEQLKNGPVPTYVIDHLKDERRTLKKIENVETRVFYIVPFHFNVLARMLIGDWCDRVQVLHNEIPIKVGLSSVPSDWSYLAKWLHLEDRDIVAGDFKGWDLGLPLSLLMRNIHMINDAYDDEFAEQRKNLFLSMLTPNHIHFGHIYRTLQGLPSGMYGTSQLGSCCSSEIVYMAMRDHGFPTDSLRVASYGDDHIATSVTKFSQIHMKNFVEQSGMDYTDAQKNPTVQPYTPREQLTFLKRYFVPYQHVYWCPRDFEDIIEQLKWFRVQPGIQQWVSVLAREMADCASWELVYHGRVVYQRVIKDLTKVEPTIRNKVPSWALRYKQVCSVDFNENLNNSNEKDTAIGVEPTVHQEGLTTFRDSGPSVEEEVGNTFPLVDVAYRYPASYFSVIERQFLVYTGALKSSTVPMFPLLRIDPVGVLFSNAYIQSRLNRVSYFRYGLNIEIRVVATKFHYGTLMFVWRPAYLSGLGFYYTSVDSQTGAVQWSTPVAPAATTSAYDNIHTASTTDPVFVSLTGNTTTVIHAHWEMPMQYAPSGDVLMNRYHLGLLDCYGVTPIAPTDIDAPQIMIYASLCDMDGFGYNNQAVMMHSKTPSTGLSLGLLPIPTDAGGDLLLAPTTWVLGWDAIPTYEAQAESRVNSDINALSTPVSTLGMIGKGISAIGSIVSTIAYGLVSPIGALMSLFGWSIPATTVQAKPVMCTVPNVVATIGTDPSMAFAYSAGNHIIGPRHKWQICDIASRYMYLGYIKTTAGSKLFTAFPVDPLMKKLSKRIAYVHPTAYMQVGQCVYYRSAVRVKIMFCASAFCTARFAVSYIYDIVTTTVISDSIESLAPTQLVDVVGDTEIIVNIPFLYPFAWKGNNEKNPIAYVCIKQITDLVSNEVTEAKPIFMAAFVSFPDFQMSGPGTYEGPSGDELFLFPHICTAVGVGKTRPENLIPTDPNGPIMFEEKLARFVPPVIEKKTEKPPHVVPDNFNTNNLTGEEFFELGPDVRFDDLPLVDPFDYSLIYFLLPHGVGPHRITRLVRTSRHAWYEAVLDDYDDMPIFILIPRNYWGWEIGQGDFVDARPTAYNFIANGGGDADANNNNVVVPGPVQQDTAWGMCDIPASIYHLAKRAMMVLAASDATGNPTLNPWLPWARKVTRDKNIEYYEYPISRANRFAAMFRFFRTSYVLTLASRPLVCTGPNTNWEVWGSRDSEVYIGDTFPTNYLGASIRLPYNSNACYLTTPVNVATSDTKGGWGVAAPNFQFTPNLDANDYQLPKVNMYIGAADDLDYQVFIGAPRCMVMYLKEMLTGLSPLGGVPGSRYNGGHTDTEVFTIDGTMTYGVPSTVTADLNVSDEIETTYVGVQGIVQSVTIGRTSGEQKIDIVERHLSSGTASYTLTIGCMWNYTTALNANGPSDAVLVQGGVIGYATVGTNNNIQFQPATPTLSVLAPSGSTFAGTGKTAVKVGTAQAPAYCTVVSAAVIPGVQTGVYNVTFGMKVTVSITFAMASPPSSTPFTIKLVAQTRAEVST